MLLRFIISFLLFHSFLLAADTVKIKKEEPIKKENTKEIKEEVVVSDPLIEKESAKKFFTTEEQVDRFIEKYTDLIGNDKIVEAFELITPYIYRSQEDIQDIFDNTQEQMEKIRPELGKFLQFNLVRKQNLKDVLLVYSVLLQYETMPLRWEIVCYKNKNGWIVLKIYWDDLPELLLQEP